MKNSNSFLKCHKISLTDEHNENDKNPLSKHSEGAVNSIFSCSQVIFSEMVTTVFFLYIFFFQFQILLVLFSCNIHVHGYTNKIQFRIPPQKDRITIQTSEKRFRIAPWDFLAFLNSQKFQRIVKISLLITVVVHCFHLEPTIVYIWNQETVVFELHVSLTYSIFWHSLFPGFPW